MGTYYPFYYDTRRRRLRDINKYNAHRPSGNL